MEMDALPADSAVQELLRPYPVCISLPVQWGDMDAMQHVNNTVYFRWFESGRVAYFERMGLFADPEASGVGPILHSTHCRYRVPLTYPDTVWVGTRVTEIGLDRVHFAHRIVSLAHGRVAAEGTAVVVTYDYREARKAPVPEPVRRRILALESEPVAVAG